MSKEPSIEEMEEFLGLDKIQPIILNSSEYNTEQDYKFNKWHEEELRELYNNYKIDEKVKEALHECNKKYKDTMKGLADDDFRETFGFNDEQVEELFSSNKFEFTESLNKLKKSGKQLKETLNITSDDIEKTIKDYRKEGSFNELYKAGEELKKVLDWNKLSEDELYYKIIEGLRGKEIADEWLKHNKVNKEN